MNRTITLVAIIGAGHVGLTLAADLISTQALHGRDVSVIVYGNDPAPTRGVLADTLQFRNIVTGRLDTVRVADIVVCSLGTPEADLLLRDSEVIVVTVPDIPAVRLGLLGRLTALPSLSGKLVVFVRAGQGGQVVLASHLQQNPAWREADVLLVEDSFYGTRASGRDITYKRKLQVNVSMYANRPTEALERVCALFPLGEQIGKPSWPDLQLRTALQLLFDPLGYIIHVGVALAQENVARTRQGETYAHYSGHQRAPCCAAGQAGP